MKRSTDVIGINEFPVQARATTLQKDSHDMFVQHDAAAQAYYVTSAHEDGLHATIIKVVPYVPLPEFRLNAAQQQRIAYRAALEALARTASEDIYYEDTGGRTS